MATLNSLTKFSLAITATTALGFLAPSANALSLTASSSGTWSNPVGGKNINYEKVITETIKTKGETYQKKTTETTNALTGAFTRKINNPNGNKFRNSKVTPITTIENTVRWGEGNNGQSGLGFEGVSGLNLDLNEIFEIGTLRHYNNVINAGTAASKVNLGLNLNFSGIGAQTFNFSFNIDETPNVGKVSDCPYYSTAICSDKITFSTPKNVNTFSIADVEYTLQIVGFSQSPNGTPVKDFISQEGGSNSASLYAKITTAPPRRVPESSSGLSLVAFGALAAGSMLNQRQKLKATAKV